jgi:hypothetical protein
MDYYISNIQLIKEELRNGVLNTFPNLTYAVFRSEHDELTEIIKKFLFDITGCEIKYFSPYILYQDKEKFSLNLTIFEDETLTFFRCTDLVQLKKIKERKKKIDNIFSNGKLL